MQLGVMGMLSSRVRRLREDLRQIANGGSFQKDQGARLRDKIAELLLQALSDEPHPLATKLAELRECVQATREAGGLPKTDRNIKASAKTERLYLVANPGR